MPADHRVPPPPAPKDSLRIYKLCVVCLGNICRSPMAEALIRTEVAAAGLAGRVHVESAGTGDWHLGEPMDRRARAELMRRGYDGSAHRARQISAGWLDQFDLLIAMDSSNLRTLQRMASGRPDIMDRIRLFRSFDPAAPEGAQVPDPYDGDPEEFSRVFDIIQAAASGLVSGLEDLLEPAGG
ncbi:MAG: low molecular weight protein-tyrosine-phosphatase [Streptosporangiaceae bacterium]